MKYQKEKAPKIGFVANSIKAFSMEGKEAVESQMRNFFGLLKKEGAINENSIFFSERISSPLEAEKVCESFTTENIEGLVILNSAFPNGNVFLTFATNPYLRHIPTILTSPPEIKLQSAEWSTNAYCGLIMNNYVAKRISRHMFTLPGWPDDEDYQNRFRELLCVIYAVKELRKDLLGRFGDAPGGFHSASGDQLAYAKTFGTRIETVDWTAVMETYRTQKAKGYKGESEFSEIEVDETFKKMISGKEILINREKIKKAARLYHAFKAIIESNGFTSSAFRCWPEMLEPYIDIAPCLSISWLLSERIVLSAACEGDWPSAVAQSIGRLLSGEPCLCLDFVNYTGGKPVVELGHCGVGLNGFMENGKIAEKSPDRQGGQLTGPAYIGQYRYGVKTGIDIVQGSDGILKMLVFNGISTPETAQNLLYCSTDLKVKNYRRLDEMIIRYGFPHHLAVAFGDISHQLKLLCEFYGIEYVNPDEI